MRRILHSRLAILSVLAGSLALWSLTCSDREYYDGQPFPPGDADIDVDSDIDSDTDSDGDTDTDVDADTDVDSDADGDPNDCEPETFFCHDGRIYECNLTGDGAEVVTDCTEPPYERCVTGLCDPGDADPHPCCVGGSSFCNADLTIPDYPAIGISYTGTWDDGYSCLGQTLGDEDEFLFRVDSEAIACEEGFVSILITGALGDFALGDPVNICGAGLSSPPTVRMSVTEDTVAVTYSSANCDEASGTITINSWGANPGEAFEIVVQATLYDQASGATKSLDISGDGTLVVSEF